ncbi:MAG: transporter substrate-binding domain-containing protein [Pseudonocardiaceae bacterium]
MRVDRVKILLALTVAFGLTACGGGSPTSSPPSAAVVTTQPPAPATPERVVVGTKVDQFGTGYLDVSTYGYSGLDVDIAKYISDKLFNDKDPYILPVSSNTRENALADGAIKFFAATYTILPERQKKFRIAGPYLVTAQGVMLGQHSPNIATIDDLRGKRVCVVGSGSNAANVLKKFVPDATPVEDPSYSACLSDLRSGNVDAFSTDLALLYGYVGNASNADMRVIKGLKIGNPIYYGVAFGANDWELCQKAAGVIKDMISSKQWDGFFNVNLPVYKANFPEYQTQIQPTDKQIDDNSCK